jgi:hypothetical protein
LPPKKLSKLTDKKFKTKGVKNGKSKGRIRRRSAKKSVNLIQTKAEEKLKFDLIEKAIFGFY